MNDQLTGRRPMARLRALLAALVAVPLCATAAPGDILFSDDFNDTSLAPWTASSGFLAGILTGGQTSGSSPRAGYTRWAAVTVTGPSFNAAVPAAQLEIWVRRGGNFNNSEPPDAGEDFVIEYRRADNSWGLLGTYTGGGTPGEIFQDTYLLPPDALHGSLAIRVRQTGGSFIDFDYWHFDDVVVTEIVPPLPLDVGSCDDFENGLSNNWTILPTTGFAGVDGATFSSPFNSLYLNGGVVEVQSGVIDTGNPLFGDLTLWIQRGADAFSEDTDGGENLVIEYFNDVGTWTALETFAGGGSNGQIYTRAYSLPANGRHAGFRLRFRQTAGSGAGFDYWHIDDVCFEELVAPILMVTKLALTISDPVNGNSNPKAIPGATVQYTLGVSNQGPGAVDADSLVIADPLPSGTALYVDTAGGDPITFIDGAVSSGLGYDYATDVSFSNQAGGGPPYNYTPMPDPQGFDAAVTGYRVNPSGSMSAASGGNNPSFNVQLRVRIE